MKKLIAIIAIAAFAVSCSDVNEDIVPDPVNPEVSLDNQQSSTGQSTQGNSGKGPKLPIMAKKK